MTLVVCAIKVLTTVIDALMLCHYPPRLIFLSKGEVTNAHILMITLGLGLTNVKSLMLCFWRI